MIKLSGSVLALLILAGCASYPTPPPISTAQVPGVHGSPYVATQPH